MSYVVARDNGDGIPTTTGPWRRARDGRAYHWTATRARASSVDRIDDATARMCGARGEGGWAGEISGAARHTGPRVSLGATAASSPKWPTDRAAATLAPREIPRP